MSIRLGYAVASVIRGIVTVGAVFFALALGSRCGPADALLGVFFSAIFLSPALLLAAAISGLIGYGGGRKALAAFGIMFALALGAAGIVQAIPHYDYPPNSPQCRFDL